MDSPSKMEKIKLDVPTLILGAGIAASGKTTFFRELAKYVYDAFLIDKDTVKEAFLLKPAILPGFGTEPMLNYKLSGSAISDSSVYYHKNVKLQSYRLLLELAKDNLAVGKHPILDAPYVKELRNGYLSEIIAPFFEGITPRIKIIFCYAPEEVIKQRMKERGMKRDQAKLVSEESWKTFLVEQPIMPPELESIDHIKVDTTLPLEERLKTALDYLRE